jgi:AraC family transcriptional regulator
VKRGTAPGPWTESGLSTRPGHEVGPAAAVATFPPVYRYDAEILTAERAQWNGFAVEVLTRRVVGHCEFDVHLPSHLLSCTLSGPAQNVEYRIDDGPIETGVLRPGQIRLLPARHHSRGHTEGAGICRTAVLLVEPKLIDLVTGGDLDPRCLEFAPSAGFSNAAILSAMTGLVHEVERPGLVGRLYAESLVLQMLIEVVRHHAGRDVATGREAIASQRLRRVTDYIEDHLGGDLSVLALAAEAGLGPAQFTHQFRRSTGLSPHQYVLRRRVERAAELLASPSQSIADVALAVGFCSQSHLTAAFRRVYGKPPGAYRRERSFRSLRALRPSVSDKPAVS